MAVPFYFVFIIVALVFFAFWIYAIIDIARSDFEGDNKMIWLLIVVLVGLIGVILYFAIGRQKKINKQDDSDEIIDSGPIERF